MSTLRVLRSSRSSPAEQDRDDRAKEITQLARRSISISTRTKEITQLARRSISISTRTKEITQLPPRSISISTRTRKGETKEVEVKKGRKDATKVAGKQMRNIVECQEESSPTPVPADSPIKKRGRPKKNPVDQKDKEESSSSTLNPSADSPIKKKRRPKENALDQKNKEEPSSSTPTSPAEPSIKKRGRGRPKKNAMDQKEEVWITIDSSPTSTPAVSPIKKKIRPKENPVDQEFKTPPRAAPAAEVARPSRQRKRPSWMMNEREGVTSGQDQSDESEEDSPIPWSDTREKKTEKSALLATPRNRERDSTPDQTEFNAIGVDKKHEPLFFTPLAGKAVMDRRRAMGILEESLGVVGESEGDILIVPVSDEMKGATRSDFPKMDVFLTAYQQSLLFSGLILHQSLVRPERKSYECMYCHVHMKHLREGRRHMVAHLRVKRFRCGLCGAGSFFCIDMRNHLQLGGCPELSRAPRHMLMSGTPCMTRKHADELSFAAHSGNPGLSLFTSGKIVSIMSLTPYLPDPVIEEMILGPTRMPPRGVSSPLDEDMMVDVESIDEPSPPDGMPHLKIEEPED